MINIKVINQNNVVIHMPNGKVFTVNTDDDTAIQLAMELITPSNEEPTVVLSDKK